MDSKIDYSKYTLEELIEVRKYMDKEENVRGRH